MISNIPPPRVPFIDGRTGLVSREWFMYLLGLRNSADLSAENITYTESYQSLSGQDNQEDQQFLYPSERETVAEEYFDPQRCEKEDCCEFLPVPQIPYGEIEELQEGLADLQPIDFYPTSMTVNTGTLDSGTVASLTLLDGTLVSISEVSGADPLRVTFSFTGVTRLSAFAFYGYYAGSPSHQLSIEIYNPDTTGWDVLGIIGSETSAQWYSFTVHNDEGYIDNGAVSTRIRHIQNGIGTHDLFLDYLELNYGAVGGSASISASSVTFVPAGGLSATNVGAALVELDSEKQATLISTSNIKTINGTTILGAGDLTVTGTGEMNVQADWTQADTGQDDYIKNKPTSMGLTAAQVQSLISIRV